MIFQMSVTIIRLKIWNITLWEFQNRVSLQVIRVFAASRPGRDLILAKPTARSDHSKPVKSFEPGQIIRTRRIIRTHCAVLLRSRRLWLHYAAASGAVIIVTQWLNYELINGMLTVAVAPTLITLRVAASVAEWYWFHCATITTAGGECLVITDQLDQARAWL